MVSAALFYGLVFVVPGILILYYGWQQLQPAVQVYRNDPIPIREVPRHDGPVEIEGTAGVDEETFTAPFTHTECPVYEYKAQEFRSSGQGGSWKTLDEGWGALPFVVDDGTGRMRIDPKDASFAFDEDKIKVKGGDQPPQPIMQYLQQNPDMDPQHDETLDLGITELNTGSRQRFVEGRLDIGESVHVYGGVEPAETGDWGSDLVGATLTTTADGTFTISDSSERGTAWELAKMPLLVVAAGLVAVGVGLFFVAVSIL